jgi:hypothetical protein
MVKPMLKNLKKTISNELELQLQLFLKESDCKERLPPYLGETSFWDRLLEVEEKAHRLEYGLSYEIESKKIFKREKTTKNLVGILCAAEKYVDGIINEYVDPYGFLKEVLEKDAPFYVCDDMYILGIERDRSGLSKNQKNKIAVQMAAQVLWYIKKNKIPTIDAMVRHLRSKSEPFYSLIEMNSFHSSRTIEDWIRPIFPLDNHLRKGRPLNEGRSTKNFNYVRPIQNVFSNNGKKVNVLKLRFIIFCLSRMLKIFGLSEEQIKVFNLVQIYTMPLPMYLHTYVYMWINEAMEEKIGRIFDV